VGWDSLHETMLRGELEASNSSDSSARCGRSTSVLLPFDRARRASDVRSLADVRRLPFTTKAGQEQAYGSPPQRIVAMAWTWAGRPEADARQLHQGRPRLGRREAGAGWGRTPDDVVHNAYGYGLFTGGLGSTAAPSGSAMVIPPRGQREAADHADAGPRVSVLCCTPRSKPLPAGTAQEPRCRARFRCESASSAPSPDRSDTGGSGSWGSRARHLLTEGRRRNLAKVPLRAPGILEITSTREDDPDAGSVARRRSGRFRPDNSPRKGPGPVPTRTSPRSAGCAAADARSMERSAAARRSCAASTSSHRRSSVLPTSRCATLPMFVDGRALAGRARDAGRGLRGRLLTSAGRKRSRKVQSEIERARPAGGEVASRSDQQAKRRG
jgi:hypothetical protein